VKLLLLLGAKAQTAVLPQPTEHSDSGVIRELAHAAVLGRVLLELEPEDPRAESRPNGNQAGGQQDAQV
jgi:hypothetical protein